MFGPVFGYSGMFVAAYLQEHCVRKQERMDGRTGLIDLQSSRTGGLEDWRTGGMEDWRTGGLEDWRTGGLED